MLKKLLFFSIVFILTHYSFGQLSNEYLEQGKKLLQTAKHDSSRIKIFFELAYGYRFSNIDSSLLYSDKAIELADKNNLTRIKAEMLSLKGATVLEAGKLPESLKLQFEALNIAENSKDTSTTSFALNRIGNIYMELGDYEKAIEYYTKSKVLFQSIGDTGMYHNEISNIGNIFYLMRSPDSALFYQQIVYDASLRYTDRNAYTRPEIMFRMGNAYSLKGDADKALLYYKKGIQEANIDNDIRNLTMNNLFIAQLYYETGATDSSRKYAYDAIKTGKIVSFRKGVYEASVLLSKLFKDINVYDSAYKYLAAANIEKDSLTGNKRFQDLQRIVLNEQEAERVAEAKRIATQNRQKQYFLIAGLGVFLVIVFILYRNNKHKQKANRKLETTVTRLRATQSQLVQSEKMASLGELTAGIAHEIQNPLNFVNNFSEVNAELIDELEQEVDKGNLAEVKMLTKDIKENEQKINHHGKRADAIVKGMLQHSRSSSGVKEPTDINKLADEYLRLAYHGLRAKDKSFNATMKTDFDETIGNINIIPQDIGRVILNLITNAFYVVDEKKKSGALNYEPTVSVSTKKINEEVEIRISDNGNGIPSKVLDKIFQPFFTTKPTGQGTGLGLSMSYDIVTKGHGGELKVNTKEGEYAEFIITLPHQTTTA